jgi:hypothetical protein
MMNWEKFFNNVAKAGYYIVCFVCLLFVLAYIWDYCTGCPGTWLYAQCYEFCRGDRL